MENTNTSNPNKCRTAFARRVPGAGKIGSGRRAVPLKGPPGACLLACMMVVAAPALASDITFEQIARVGDVPPGRETDDVLFRGKSLDGSRPDTFSNPCINDSGEVVFRAVSCAPTSFSLRVGYGIYVKRPGEPLAVLVDTTLDENGAPRFPVPGRPETEGTYFYFTNVKPPIVNNAGDVLFHAKFGGDAYGSGFYTTTTTGGPIVKIADTSDEVPGFAGLTFKGFEFSSSSARFLLAAMNDSGQVVIMGRFDAPDDTYEDVGLYGTSVSGGPLTCLADATTRIYPSDQTVPFRAIAQDDHAVLTNSGHVVFEAGIGNPPPASLLLGIFAVPVDGSSNAVTVAMEYDPAPDSGGIPFGSRWDGHDANDSGTVVFHNLNTYYWVGLTTFRGVYAGDVTGGAVTRVVDNISGNFEVPGLPGADFTYLEIGPVNESGKMGFFSFDSDASSPGGGIYVTDTSGPAVGLVANNTFPAPGRGPDSTLTSFNPSPAVNDQGHIVLSASGEDGSGGTILGLYFYNMCTEALERIVDDSTAQDDLGTAFPTSGADRKFSLYRDYEAHAGMYRSINNDNVVAFHVSYETYDSGVYIADVPAGGLGPPTITCPDDITLPCPADTSVEVTGSATAADACTGMPITPTYSDAPVPGCGDTETITRTWVADDGAGNTSTCDQIITVQDATPPDITCPTDLTLDCPADTSAAMTGSATGSDTCGSVAITSADSTVAGCGDTETITRTWTADDECGNSSVCDQVIVVVDQASPDLTCPPDATLECPADTSVENTGSAGGSDTCGNVTITSADSSVAGCGGTEVITRTWFADDDCGNSSLCDQLITVEDTTAPDVTCPADMVVECDGSGNTAALNGWLASASADDVCGGVSVADDFSGLSDDCGATGSATVAWTAMDACGLTNTCSASFVVQDTTPPSLTVDTTPLTVVDIDCSGDEAVTLPEATATDACDPAVTVSNDALGMFPAGQTRAVTFTATDDCDQTGTASVDVAVKYGATLEVHVHVLRFAWGQLPGVIKEPLVGVTVYAYARPGGEFCSHHQPGWHGWHWWRHIVEGCDESHLVNSAVTDENGIALIDVPPGDYIVITFFDFDHDGENDHFLGRYAPNLTCGKKLVRRLRLLITPRGKRLAAKIRRFCGSELLIAEPDLIVWDAEEQEYPFGLESVGDWDVSVSLTPPEGFDVDADSLSTEVNNEMEALQFTVTEVGSALVPTQTSLRVTHNGTTEIVRSRTGILLTPDYARSRGFDVAALRAAGLIYEKPKTQVEATQTETQSQGSQ